MFDKIKKWLFGEPNKLKISDVEMWSTDKAEFVCQIFSKRLDEEKEIKKSLKAKAIFLLSALGVILTIIFTIIGSNITEISKWESSTQIIFIIIFACLAGTIIVYLHLYLKSDNLKNTFPILSQNQIDSIITNKSETKRQLLNKQIVSLYDNFLALYKENNEVNFWFKFGDIIFILGVGIAVGYAIYYILCKSPELYYIILIIIISVIYIIAIIGIIKSIPQTIKNIRYFVTLSKNNIKLKDEKRHTKITKMNENGDNTSPDNSNNDNELNNIGEKK